MFLKGASRGTMFIYVATMMVFYQLKYQMTWYYHGKRMLVFVYGKKRSLMRIIRVLFVKNSAFIRDITTAKNIGFYPLSKLAL
jgi:Na+/alanine symporter